MPREEVLMIGLGGIEGAAGFEGGDDLAAEAARLAQLVDIRLGDARLLLAGREDGRAILRADIRTLAIELRGIVHHREVDLQQAAIAHLARVVDDADGFGMTGAPRADLLVVGALLGAAG